MPDGVPSISASAGFDRVERYLGWSAGDRAGRRVAVAGRGAAALTAEAVARGYGEVGDVFAGDATDAFDICLLGDDFEMSREPLRFLIDVRRRLRPGGALFVAVPRGGRGGPFSADRTAVESLLVRAGYEHVRFVGMPSGRVRPAGTTGALAVRSAEAPIDERRGRVSVVLPVFNEKQTFSILIERLLEKQVDGLDMEIVIVESRSTDGTREDVATIASHPRVKVVWQERPRGKGNAVRAGLAVATGDFVLIQDADLEYDIGDYDMLFAPLREFRAAFVLGVRHGKDGHTWKVRQFSDQVFVGKWMNFGHLLFTTLFNVVYGQRLSDPFTMYKVFRRDCLSGLTLECNAFDFDWELAGKLVRCGYTPLELPVNYESRSFSEGKKVRMFRDPLTWIRACFKYRFVRLKDERLGERN